MLTRIADGPLLTRFGKFHEYLYYDGRSEVIALVMGTIRDASNVHCRVHSHCVSAHIFNSVECDCREQMEMAQTMIAEHGLGVIVWLDQDGRGNGHAALLKSAYLREQGMTQSEAYKHLGYPEDARSYRQVKHVLDDLGIKSIALITNSPDKVEQMRGTGVCVETIVPAFIAHPENEILEKTYAEKKSRGHTIDTE